MKTAIQFTNPFVLIFLIGTVLTFIVKQFLEFIDYKARTKNAGKIPEELADITLAQQTFDTEKLKKICDYENAKYFAWIPESICSLILDLALIIFGFYPFVFNLVCNWFGFTGGIINNWLVIGLFLILISLPEAILSIPFELNHEFNLEKKFGFSNMTFGLWIADNLKELGLTLVLGALLDLAASVFLVKCPDSWWWILALVMICFSFIMQIIYPKFIAPIFNKFEPLPEGELKDKITAILDKCGFKNGGLFVMNASKRSKHSNAYFSGFGKSKQIVLYDTLINSMSSDELTAVLGHELGHYKLHHITKRLATTIPEEFAMMFIMYLLAHIPALYQGFGFTGFTAENISQGQFIGLFLAFFVFSSITQFISPIAKSISRKQEYQADAYSAKLCGTGEHLITGLIKLNSENLSELLPPKLYIFWNFDHPALWERVAALKKLESKFKS